MRFVYRLIKHARAKRVLFLVDRNNLGRQTFKEFDQFVIPDDGRKFSELYNVQHLQSNILDGVSMVHITTIQRLYSMLSGEPDFDTNGEESSLWEAGGALDAHYRQILTALGRGSGLIPVIFRKAQNKIQDPAKLKRLIELIDGETWIGLPIWTSSWPATTPPTGMNALPPGQKRTRMGAGARVYMKSWQRATRPTWTSSGCAMSRWRIRPTCPTRTCWPGRSSKTWRPRWSSSRKLQWSWGERNNGCRAPYVKQPFVLIWIQNGCEIHQ